MRGAPGRGDRHASHVFTAEWCDAQYCQGCGTFVGSLHASIAEPCAMDLQVEAPAVDFDWLKSLRSVG